VIVLIKKARVHLPTLLAPSPPLQVQGRESTKEPASRHAAPVLFKEGKNPQSLYLVIQVHTNIDLKTQMINLLLKISKEVNKNSKINELYTPILMVFTPILLVFTLQQKDVLKRGRLLINLIYSFPNIIKYSLSLK
jgi:hypothetical protein